MEVILSALVPLLGLILGWLFKSGKMDKFFDSKQRLTGPEFAAYLVVCSILWLLILVAVYSTVFWLEEHTAVRALGDVLRGIYSEVELGFSYFLNFTIGCSGIYTFLLLRYYPETLSPVEVSARQWKIILRFLIGISVIGIVLLLRFLVGLYFYVQGVDVMVLYEL